MATSDQIALIKELIEKAEQHLAIARELLNQTLNDKNTKATARKKKGVIETTAPSIETKVQETSPGEVKQNIIEGLFDGQQMIGPDEKTYPVPANYASKSKLIPGDKLKLTIQENGSFIYKQIGPTERQHAIGPLTYENGQYMVLANGKGYKVLLASVTYYKAEIGDKIAIIIPKNQDSDWGAIDHVLPKEFERDANPPDDEIF